MSFGEKTLVAIGAFLVTVFWIFVLIYIAGVWLGCIPNHPNPEYACPTRGQQLLRSAIAIIVACIATALFFRGLRRAGEFRSRR
jgi:hypothetical protein